MLTNHEEILWHSPQENFTWNANNICYWYMFENYLLIDYSYISNLQVHCSLVATGHRQTWSSAWPCIIRCTRIYWYDQITGIFCMSVHGTISIGALPTNALQVCSTRPSAGRISDLLMVWPESIRPCLQFHTHSFFYVTCWCLPRHQCFQWLVCYSIVARPQHMKS